MRVLMISTPVPTHFTPLVPLAWGLRAAGHEVLVVGREEVVGAAASAGLNAVGIGDRLGLDDMIVQYLGDKRPLQALGRPTMEQLSMVGAPWIPQTLEVLPAYLDLARDFGPDLVVADPIEFISLFVGDELGVPVVHQRWGVDPVSDQVRGAGETWFKDILAERGLTGLPRPAVVLDPCPPSLQLAGTTPGTPMRFVPFNGNGRLPEWLRRDARERGTAKRVAVSLGRHTLAYNGVPLMRNVLDALGGLSDTEVLATVDEEYREALGEVPGNVRVIDPVPLHLLLGSCRAVVHHGGSGTAMTASAFGLPQLVLPQLADQFWHGDALARVGAGITIEDVARQDEPEPVREAVAALLGESSYEKAAAELREEIARMPAPSQVVADLEELVAAG
ncbi:nucleotide disphospho-sugar-binding domain-containing protein [Streptomyces graminilatus]|uniref:nucleotide disphospho-sugar-binding domain-containing protein n=1 Tax=Streptomyces graminilatus TaxID=1464070 RepID=UPI0006E1717A|nr:nucleotide disphospho-sugar-binding domain-containing protein [Streptomyces graminilatus]